MSVPPPRASPDPRPAVAIFRSPVFNPSETFIAVQANALARYRPLIVGLEAKGSGMTTGHPLLLPTGAAERAAFALGRVAAMAQRLRAFSPALVHAHFATDGLAALPLARALGVPLVTTLHGYDVSLSRARLLRSGRISWTRYALLRGRLMRAGALFVAVSEAVRRRALALGYPAERTVVLPIGVDLTRFRAGDRPEPGLVLHVGRLVEKKGTALLLEAFVRVRRAQPGSRLDIVGDGPLRPALERRAARLGLGDSVRFLGGRPPGEVAAMMRRAWLLAAPSLTARDGDSEGLPTVLAEAAACGLPAVASDHSGNPEAVLDGRTGFVVAEGDVAMLADRLTALIGSPELRQRMGLAARALAEERFDLARQTALLEDQYDRVVAVRGG